MSSVHIEDPEQRREWIEGRGDRLELAREAGWGRVSWWSVTAGVLTVIGVMAVCAGVVVAFLQALDITTDTLSDSEWTRAGFGVGLVSAVLLFGCFALGGYTAGRMARRAGVRHGLLVFVVGLVLILGAIGVAQLEGGLAVARDRFDDLGAPTGESTWTGIALVTIGVALAGALSGSLLGGARGERWYQRLVARAMDPGIGPEADLRAEVEAQRQAAARAMERARQAGVGPTEDEPAEEEPTREEPTREEPTREEPTREEPTREPTRAATVAEGRNDRRPETASTAAGPPRTPSSSS